MAYYADERRYFEEIAMHGQKKRFLFEGDSWFSIMDLANIPLQFDSKLDLSILCLADPGDTLEDLADGRQFDILERLIKNERHGQKWDALFFSAGGNDIVGPEIKGLLKASDIPGSADPADYLKADAVEETFRQMRQRFVALKSLRDRSKANPETPIFIHTYSYLTPRDVAHRVLAWKVSGPWVFPHMSALGIDDCVLQQRIVRLLLDGFHDMLKGIADEVGSNFHVIDTRKALQPVACAVRDSDFELWRDEIHPSSKGFARLAEKFLIPFVKDQGVI